MTNNKIRTNVLNNINALIRFTTNENALLFIQEDRGYTNE